MVKLENLEKINPEKRCCETCLDYNALINGRSNCIDGNNMKEMKKQGYPCYIESIIDLIEDYEFF